MRRFIKNNVYLILTFAVSFFIFFRSLFVFYTNDDFFLLKISNATNFHDFLNFFNIFRGSEGLAMYRPLTTQLFYFLAHSLFNLNPMPLHIISFVVFFAVIYLVYELSSELVKVKKIALISAFLYAVSATHFAHLYYLATFQELGMTLFVLLSCISFLRKRNVLSFVFFVLALMSKETAVITPPLLVLIHFYQKYSGNKIVSFKKLQISLLPFVICLFVYLLIRIYSYGFATGDSYIWNFSIKKLVNTLTWYLVWSLNLPETLVDFIGPGLAINPNLFLYWSKQIISIFILFFVQGILLAYILVKIILGKSQKVISESNKMSIFCIAWFLITLLPVAFLPIHKFTFYLTLPLVGIVFRIGYLLENKKISNIILGTFLIVWLSLSILTINHTVNTNWITQSEMVASRVRQYFEANGQNLAGRNIYFIDTTKDSDLPWSPTQTLKTVLSDKNFFDIFYPNLSASINYTGLAKTPKTVGDQVIEARQFLGY